MRSALLGLAAILALTGSAADPTVIQFDSFGFLRFPPQIVIGEAAGVAVTPTRVYVFSRGNVSGPAAGAAAAQLLEFDTSGRFIREVAPGAYAWSFAHAVRVDRDRNIWVVDSGSDMVIRLNSLGQVTMVLGRRRSLAGPTPPAPAQAQPPPSVEGLFRQPTDVTWDADGNVYVADGHANSRIAKFDTNGKWVTSFGTYGKGNGQFNVPHSIVADASGNIFVGDTGNRRIQVFDTGGKHLREIKIDVPVPADVVPLIGPKPSAADAATLSGTPWAMCMTLGTPQMLFVADAYPGRIYKVDPATGMVLGMLGEAGRQLKQFGGIHSLACPTDKEIYVAELLNWRVQRLILR